MNAVPIHDRSRALADRLRHLVPGGAHAYSKAYGQWPACAPPILQRGQGPYVWDADGNRYIDWFAGLSCLPLGHAHPAITSAVTRALEHGAGFQLPTTAELEAAETFLDKVARDEMVKFGQNGSDAVDAALRLARHATSRLLIARCADHPFYSTADWFISTTAARSGTLPVAGHTVSFPYNDTTALRRLFAEHGRALAALILEPVRFTTPDAEFFTALRTLCSSHGVVLVFDETVTALKYHLNGARTFTGITPDLTTWGKSIGSGLPISALTGRRDLMTLADTGASGAGHPLILSTTYGGNSASLAALTATVTFTADHEVLRHNHEVGAALRTAAAESFARENLADRLQLIGHDAFLALQATNADGHPDPPLKVLFIQEMVRRGHLFRGIFYPTYAHTPAELQEAQHAITAATKTCAKALTDGFGHYLHRRPPPRVL